MKPHVLSKLELMSGVSMGGDLISTEPVSMPCAKWRRGTKARGGGVRWRRGVEVWVQVDVLVKPGGSLERRSDTGTGRQGRVREEAGEAAAREEMLVGRGAGHASAHRERCKVYCAHQERHHNGEA